MGRSISFETKGGKISEGLVFCKWIHNRLIKNNKNVLLATTGPTGSSKSYQDLRKAELWYKYHFNEEFPIDNCCFSVDELIRRIHRGNLRRGEILIFEEAGVNLGSLDFQNKISKMFTYVLQSFRSMNIGIFFNLPYLSMLNKQARLLLHANFVTCGIDKDKKIAMCKPYFHQVNQKTGKIYTRFLRIKVNGRTKKVKVMQFGVPSAKLINKYESKKTMFLADLTEDFVSKLNAEEKDKRLKMARRELTRPEREAYEDYLEGLTIAESAAKRGKSGKTIWSARVRAKKKGYKITKGRFSSD